MMIEKNKSCYHIKTVSRAIDVLEQFTGDKVELGVSELSERLSLRKNNIFRLLATLQSRNYIEQNPATGNYLLGVKNLQLGQTMVRQMGLLRQARPVLEALAGACNETVDLSVLRGGYVVCVDLVETGHPVRVAPRLGCWLPAHCTAAGKVCLANLSEQELVSLWPRGALQRRTPLSVADLKALQRQLRRVAQHGYASEDEELDLGVAAVGAPIRDVTGKVVGAISISGPLNRITQARIACELVPLVRSGAADVSRRLGFKPAGGSAIEHASSAKSAPPPARGGGTMHAR